jgi:hypothetical protein
MTTYSIGVIKLAAAYKKLGFIDMGNKFSKAFLFSTFQLHS